MKKILVGLLAVFIVLAVALLVLVNRWSRTPYGHLDPKAAVLLKYVEITGKGSSFAQVTPAALRTWYKESWRGKGVKVEWVEDRLIPGPRGEIPVRIYADRGRGRRPAILYYHGGGWVAGGIDTHDNVTRYLASVSSCVVVSVDYRLAPEHPFPAAVEDAYAALQWVRANAEAIGADPQKISVAGDSAGANLAAVVSLLSRDKKGPEILCQALIYPVTDLSSMSTPSYEQFAERFFLTREGMEWFRSLYVPNKEDWDDPYVSPLLSKDHRNLPAAVVITAQFDPLRDEGEAYAEKLRQAGVPVKLFRYEGMIHGFVSFPELFGQARDALDRIAAEVNRSR